METGAPTATDYSEVEAMMMMLIMLVLMMMQMERDGLPW
jgi:hypothetical protein